MARPASVWFDNTRNIWRATIRGHKVKVADGTATQKEAEQAWHEMHAKDIAVDLQHCNPVRVVFELYLDYLEANHPVTYPTAKRFLKSFCRGNRDVPVKDLTSGMVDSWLSYEKTWGQTSRAQAVQYVMSALNWAARPDNRIIPSNPLRGMPRPAARSRGKDALIDPADHAVILAAAKPSVRDLLSALRLTGTRPSNLCRAEAADVDWARGAIVLTQHKTAEKTGRKLSIPIPARLRPLLERLCRERPSGPLFRRENGEAWTSTILAQYLLRLRERLERRGVKLKGKYIAYGHRHTVATDLLEAGVPDAQVAAILGHSGTAMIYRHYGHLARKTKTLADAMDRHLRGDGETASESPPVGHDAGELPVGPKKPREPDVVV
jgi:integrase